MKFACQGYGDIRATDVLLWLLVAFMVIGTLAFLNYYIRIQKEYANLSHYMQELSIHQPAQQDVEELTEQQRQSLVEFQNKRIKIKVES